MLSDPLRSTGLSARYFACKQMADRFNEYPEVIRNYLFYLETIKGRSPLTVQGYAIDLRTFFRFMVKHKYSDKYKSTDVQDVPIIDIDIQFIRSISLSDVYEFLHYTLSEKSNNPRTRARKVSTIRGFFNYLHVKEKIIEYNPVKELEVPSAKKSLPVFLSLDQAQALLASVSGKTPYRDYCILVFFLNCGMRLSELVGINLSDIESDTLKLRGKGNKERVVYLTEACITAMQAYCLEERSKLPVIKDKNALFLSSRSGKRLSGRHVENIVKGALDAAGLANLGFSPHKLRHTAATLMYQYGEVDIRALQELLGHENLGTTQIYTHVSKKQLKEAVNKNPLSKVKK